ncbi:MAG: GTP cyclohydrolase I FolE [Acidobacteria bacterium]|nr:GTP cyclohydrolase I FolE [Acidobacteriota bacterium]
MQSVSERLLIAPKNGKVLDELVEMPNPAERAATLLLQFAGEDLTREGLKRTPERFAKAMGFLFSGYDKTPEQVLGQGVFEAEGSGLVSVREVEFFSLCEHHMLPFWGKASVAYYPSQKIVGLSKIPRLVDLFARRLQVQERLTRQVADALMEAIEARAVGVRVEAEHMCMMMRGVEKQCSHTASEYFLGIHDLSAVERDRLFQSL